MSTVHEHDPVRLDEFDDGSVWRITLATPKANIVDETKIRVLTEMFVRAREEPDLRVIVLEADGPNFSFGASVEEHLPEQVAEMLGGFHGLVRAMADASVPLLCAVQGQCLGGGLELATFCHRVFAAPDSQLGQPEIVLGVFAPVASLVLPERIGRAAADQMCLTGHSLTAPQALAVGLVDEVVDDPRAAALAYAREHFLSRSASSLRHAVRAVRHSFHTRLFTELAAVERMYLDDLMTTSDAEEGIRAFLDKRSPEWRNE